MTEQIEQETNEHSNNLVNENYVSDAPETDLSSNDAYEEDMSASEEQTEIFQNDNKQQLYCNAQPHLDYSH